MQIQLSAGFTFRWNGCMKWFSRLIEVSSLSLWVAKNLFLQFIKCFEVDVFEHPRFCDEFSHLMTLRFVANSTLCWINISMEWMFEWFKRSVEVSNKLFSCQKSFTSGYQMFWSICFWASQILWWIRTSSDSTFGCKFNSLLDSHFDRMDVWNDLNVLWNYQIHS